MLTQTFQNTDSLFNSARSGYYYCGQIVVGAVALQFTLLQLWNPVGSGRIIQTIQSRTNPTVTGLVDTFFSSAPLATLGVSQPSLIGGAPGVGELRSTTVAASPEVSIKTLSCAATGNTAVIETVNRYILTPGTGVTLRVATVNVGATHNMIWAEYLS